MRLTLKLVVVVILGIIVLLAIDGYLLIHRDIDVFETDMKRDARLYAHFMKGLIADAWQVDGPVRTLNLIEEANEEEHLMRMRWVWIDAPPGDPRVPLGPREKLDPVAHGQEVNFKDIGQDGEVYLRTYTPVDVGAGRPGALEISESYSTLRGYARSTMLRTLRLTGAMILLSGILVLWLSLKFVGLPLRGLTQQAKCVGAGDLSIRIPIHGQDELSELAGTMNLMCEQLAAAREKVREESSMRIAALVQLRHADRLRSVGRLASGLAHELGTPLNVVSGRAGMIGTGRLSATEIAENANIIKTQTQRMTKLIRQVLDFSRSRTPDIAPVDLQQLVHQTLDLITPLAQRRTATLVFAGEEGQFTVNVDAGQLQQVLMNLIMNALQAISNGGKIEVGIRRESPRSPDQQREGGKTYVSVYVQDDGEGIAEENLQHIFEPFFTTRDIGEGTGLGLSIAYGIIREHGGWIEVTSKTGQGSCFSVYLPQEAERCADAS